MTEMRSKTRGQRLRYLRESCGWDQGELEHRSGISRSQISAIENDRSPHTRRETVERLAATVGVSWLMLEEGTEMADEVEYPAWARSLPDLPPEHVAYIRSLVLRLAEEEASQAEA